MNIQAQHTGCKGSHSCNEQVCVSTTHGGERVKRGTMLWLSWVFCKDQSLCCGPRRPTHLSVTSPCDQGSGEGMEMCCCSVFGALLLQRGKTSSEARSLRLTREQLETVEHENIKHKRLHSLCTVPSTGYG